MHSIKYFHYQLLIANLHFEHAESFDYPAAFNLKEKFMVNDLPIQYRNDEIERNAYNAAFYELGFRWHWDSHTYYELLSHSQTRPNASAIT